MRLDDPASDSAPGRIRRCGKCRYSLAKLPSMGRCPACGENFGTDQSPFDHICLGCRYDLTGLAPNASCPECGLSIERSRLGDSLVHSPKAYVRAIHLGAGIALLGAMIWTIVPSAGAVVLVYLDDPGAPGPSRYFQPALFTTLGSIPIGLVLAVVGLWRMSVPDPLPVIRERGDRARQTLRISLAVAVGLGVLQVLFALGLMLSYGLLDNFVFQALAALILIASIATVMVSAASYTAWIAHRIGDPRLVDNAKSLRIAGGIVGALSAVAWMSCPCIGLLSLPFTLTMLILYDVVLVRLRRQLHDILRAPCQIREIAAATSSAGPSRSPISQAPGDCPPNPPPP